MRLSGPLLTTIRTSHTCRVWRLLLLDSPSIWGKLINLDFLYFRPNLHYELIMRTRNAPLWTKGSELLFHPASNTCPKNTLLMPFLQEHWKRIHFLRLSLSTWDLFEELWAAFSQDAPQLRHVEICNPRLHWTNQICPSYDPLFKQQELFAGCAPLLNSFSCALFPIRPSAPWIPQLIHFDSRAAHYPFSTSHDIVLTLLRMTRLEELRITLKDFTPQVEQQLKVRDCLAFPHLRDVTLNAGASVCRWFMGCLVAPEQLQTIRVLVQGATFVDGQPVLNQFTKMISRALAVSQIRLRFLHLKLTTRTIHLHTGSNTHQTDNDEAIPDEVLYRLKTLPPSGEHQSDLPCFDLPPVSFVTHLSIDISSSLVTEHLPKYLEDLMKSFISVTNLSGPGHIISILLKLGAALLPALEVIQQTTEEDIPQDLITEFGFRRSAYGNGAIQIKPPPT
ncbi:hypothetical protein CPB83DRAFT_859716 [Crepidotus variabilis]|uniref:F-box domain-containing protein n=1 Tax=Crepidotus variabilis TaxID=179855 RepID=A0A9P6EAM5_9AGAR|nr:hypothetical protein CPB83DRAFT_859716 [Crepidotus variabilis]